MGKDQLIDQVAVTFIGGGFSSSKTLRFLCECLVDSQTLSSAKQKIKTGFLDPYFKPND
jgi:hypothetical protein